jgi:hypothetical protein
MKFKGVSYDVGIVYWENWRPDFDPKVVHRELEIIKNDLHCNAVGICGRDLDRLMTATEDALEQGLYVLLSPRLWDKSQEDTLTYLINIAKGAEMLRKRWPEKLVFSIGSELTLFMQGIVKGRNVTERLNNLMLKFKQEKLFQPDKDDILEHVHAGEFNKLLNTFLVKANSAVRNVFHGKVTYASLIWESVDWNLFDIIGVDHYRNDRIKEKYVDMLKPLFSYGKPVNITEFGYRTFQGATSNATGIEGDIIDLRSLFLHYIFGRLVKPRLKGIYLRDEALQARELVDQLSVLEKVGVEGAYISTFVTPLAYFDENPMYDLDMASYSLVKSYRGKKHGQTYHDLKWEPKESFHAVADYYLKH